MSRKCARDGCVNAAREQKGGRAWEKLCSDCNRDRLARRAKSLAQTKCRCGNCAPLGEVECGGCQRKREQRESDFIENAENLRRYYLLGITP